MSTVAVLAVAVFFATLPTARAADCDPNGADAADVTAARAEIDGTCNCATAASHCAYVHCVAGVISDRVGGNQLSASCGRYLRSCSSRSTCGRPGFVTCCRERSNGTKSCVAKRDASKCKAPRGGTASLGHTSICCDACEPEGPQPVCGNGVIEDGETCDSDDPLSGLPHNVCPNPDGKLRCAKPGERDACQRCCGKGAEEGGTAGALCPVTDCCGFCANFFIGGARCTSCNEPTCTACGTAGQKCNDTSCCPGYQCQAPMSGLFWTCCGVTGTTCGAGTECCSGSCTASVCD